MSTLRRRSFIARSSLVLGGLALGAGCKNVSSSRGGPPELPARDLVGSWPLRGDPRDHSGNGNHGIAHGSGAMM